MYKDFYKPENYVNRELSWIDFNGRVLGEATDVSNPLLERANFLGITQSNVDEFFMVRVASLHKLAAANVTTTDASGLTPEEQLNAVNRKEHRMVQERYEIYNQQIIPQLAKEQIDILHIKDLDQKQYEFIRRYFNDELMPVLTPMADDSSRPFPFISNSSLNIAISLRRDPTAQQPGKHETLEGDQEVNKKQNEPHDDRQEAEIKFATVRVPEIYKRLVRLPGENNFILIDELVKEFLSLLFPGYQILATATYRVMRDMDLDVAEEDTSDLLRAVKHQLREREHGQVMRLEVEDTIDEWLEDQLIDNLHVSERSIYRVDGPVDLTFLKKLSGMVDGHADLRFKPFKPYLNPQLDMEHNIFKAIRQKDYLVQHPYDNFDAVVNFIHQAATDPAVLAIKMTLYRVSGNSPIIKYLGMAAQQGKQVTVLVEVKARFDEQNNVRWAQRLEQMGCHVIYGLVGLKTHCKVALVIRRDEDGLRRYMHLGTGNYNDVTAHFYTDMGLFTCAHELGVDMTSLFNMLSGFARPPYFYQLRVSPDGIRNFINQKIDDQIAVAKSGNPALIRMKMNSLSDKQIIAHLYDAAANGVKVQLLVRGITCLRNDLPELHGNIEVHSIVGRFLEHSRIYYFESNGHEEIYLASADMMTRNLNRRVEELYPVTQADTKARAIQIFDIMWRDNVKTRVLEGDHYERLDRDGAAPFNSQEYFVQEAVRLNKQDNKQQKARRHFPNVFETLSKHVPSLHLKEKDDANGKDD
ncbi:MAG: RNA degradosome polyphosphate kinase [Limosilactobacillus oris]|jgi:polyphosphate kinase|uniref:RNA degradosome polyphosphate kinase n=1 Tax=Limosilactobacillus oris TaxID=1632 RepID=UPI000789F174|nr:RNA degradosome polyphosphate kinase [Limosilactobacillus oris]AMS08091.1 RNA degradosome polyphosphate kinase [Limosilactobacillus oris]MCH3911157.1 RNA degradosome polyphosphate kinase [Limosilactobacillus oris]MCH3938408.1 RNA degradosome polyphosphate kinase [Limosilactobacillus oris]MCI1980629.1 RNA degradosome polyphosphate kinase [Limosilactobacillus oris]MCI2043067.1 RNA degradosome polyphosphate kinase [Limosilactobacillus oris]